MSARMNDNTDQPNLTQYLHFNWTANCPIWIQNWFWMTN